METSPYSVLSQIGLVVDDVRKTARFLKDLLGIEEWKFEDWPPQNRPGWQSSIEGKEATWKTRLAFANFKNIELELIENAEGISAYSEFLQTKGKGIHHLLFEVDNLEDAVFRLKRKGIKEKMSATGRLPGTKWVLMDTLDLLGFDLELKNKIK